jgi:hypothetical protein
MLRLCSRQDCSCSPTYLNLGDGDGEARADTASMLMQEVHQLMEVQASCCSVYSS